MRKRRSFSRKFGGKVYTPATPRILPKGRANKLAKSYRLALSSARVVKVKGGYKVFARGGFL